MHQFPPRVRATRPRHPGPRNESPWALADRQEHTPDHHRAGAFGAGRKEGHPAAVEQETALRDVRILKGRRVLESSRRRSPFLETPTKARSEPELLPANSASRRHSRGAYPERTLSVQPTQGGPPVG